MASMEYFVPCLNVGSVRLIDHSSMETGSNHNSTCLRWGDVNNKPI